ncbi:Transposase [endosymbiont of Ridgeia piscesae]|uniref:Transposase n=2 Tax=endosymbiont of Ridgeia piscesae TaxID=54398 RepID=A0A0T5Z745_9GAMM|nr:Transposase [endosymbiont of Ridgeia piscesae]KRT58607.1 Transposase [endosymbiont of Ridgeia piscesae]
MTSNSNDSSLYWQQHVVAWQDSGLTQRAYCAQRGLSSPSFGYWARKLRRTDKPMVQPRAKSFVPVTLAAPVGSGLSLVLPDGLEIRGLAAIVEQELGHNPFEGALYAFSNRRRDKIKLLYWEDNGFVLYYKSLAEERFHWPASGDEVVPLDGQQINWLLDGYDLVAMKGHRKLHYEATF